MTAVLGLRKVIDGCPQVLIGSDSLFAQGWTRTNAKDRSKLITFPNFIVGFSGICTIQRVLYDIRKDKKLVNKSIFKMRGEEDALEFGRLVFSEVKARLEEMGEQFNDSVGNLVIATPTQLFDVDRFAFAMECEEYTTSGCVDDFLAGFIAARYDNVTDCHKLVDLMYDALNTAVDYSTGVHPPIVVKFPTYEPKTKSSAKTKKKKRSKTSKL